MKARPVLLGVLLFLSGGIVTLVVEHMVHPRVEAHSPVALHGSILAQIDSTLRLTPAQRDSIHAIFARHQSRVDSGWHSINQRMRVTMDSVHVEIQRVLDPTQTAAFHELMRQRHGVNPPSGQSPK
jgi:Spy/CpxP family protein refolding chaperone